MSIGVGLTQTLLVSRQPRVIGLPQSRQEARARDSTGRLRGAVPQEAVRFMDVLVSVLTGKPWSRCTGTGQRIALPNRPARLAVGLVLGSGLVSGYPPSFAPPCVFRLREFGSPVPVLRKEHRLRLRSYSRMVHALCQSTR